MRLPDPRPTVDKDAALVQAMFERVAPRYDVANTMLSLGQDRHWRRVATRAVDPQPGELILDVAAGTGALSHELLASGARVVPLDFSWTMLATGAEREGDARRLWWTNGDGTRLPFARGRFDAVTIAFGLRNLPDTAAGLRELARVTRPGGRLVVLEFSSPTWAPFREIYRRYLVGALPAAARMVTSHPAAYRYLAHSILAWPDQGGLARIITAAGWEQVRWKSLTGGIVAAHHARCPG
ncbi:MAG: ubiquinone/menaquinone biosynthesis methyltransferase [Nitriliruptorales bacterium]|nr:ubiquinone/menaquinone biosynthesis methyltransferase [Nitriliruptorales bacterium]